MKNCDFKKAASDLGQKSRDQGHKCDLVRGIKNMACLRKYETKINRMTINPFISTKKFGVLVENLPDSLNLVDQRDIICTNHLCVFVEHN